MLVIGRKNGQKIYLMLNGIEIEIMVRTDKRRTGNVSVSINAPQEVKILRGEIKKNQEVYRDCKKNRYITNNPTRSKNGDQPSGPVDGGQRVFKRSGYFLQDIARVSGGKITDRD